MQIIFEKSHSTALLLRQQWPSGQHFLPHLKSPLQAATPSHPISLYASAMPDTPNSKSLLQAAVRFGLPPLSQIGSTRRFFRRDVFFDEKTRRDVFSTRKESFFLSRLLAAAAPSQRLIVASDSPWESLLIVSNCPLKRWDCR